MQQTIEQLLQYLYGIWHYRWYMLVAAWIIGPIGWLVVLNIPNTYESTAQVYVDTDTILKPLLKGLSVDSLDVSEQLGLMAKELLSRPNLERVVRKVDLDIYATTPVEKEAALSRLQANTEIRALRTHRTPRPTPPNLYVLSVKNGDPNLAYKIVQAMLDIFVEGTLSGSRSDSIVARKFLDKEISEYEEKLIAAENRLREFQKKNVKSLPAQGSSYYQRLNVAQSNLEAVDLELREEQFRRNELMRQLSGSSARRQIIGQNGSATLSPIDQRIMNLQTRLDDLLLSYTEEHPDVSEVKNSLAELEKKKQTELELTSGNDRANSQNPVYQQLKLALGEVEANIAAIQVRRDEYKNRVQELQKQVETLPQIEADLLALNRDYTVNKANYDSLLERRASAKMSAAIEQTGEQVKIKVIEPPVVPLSPSSPNRPMLISVVLILAIGAGVAIAFFMAQIKAVFYSQQDIHHDIGLPVIGTVSYSPLAHEISKAKVYSVLFIVASAGILVAYMSVLLMNKAF